MLEGSWGRQNNAPSPNTCGLIPRTHGYVTSPGRERIKVPDRMKVASQLTLDRESVLDYPGGPSGISSVLINEEEGGRSMRVRWFEKDATSVAVFGDERGPLAKEGRKTQVAGNDQEIESPPRASRIHESLLTLGFQPILNFRPPDLEDSKFMLFHATEFVVIC